MNAQPAMTPAPKTAPGPQAPPEFEPAPDRIMGSFGRNLCPLFYSSDKLDALTEALSQAQSQIGAAIRDQHNEHRNYNYSDLNSVWDACRDALTQNGFAILQPLSPSPVEGCVDVITVLSHKSGQYIASVVRMQIVTRIKEEGFVLSMDPHAIGSAITYGRRYGLSALVGVVSAGEDDDGERAQQYAEKHRRPQQQGQKPKGSPPPKPKQDPPVLTEEQVQIQRRIVTWLFNENNGQAKAVGDKVSELTKGMYRNVKEMPGDHLMLLFSRVEAQVKANEAAQASSPE